MNKFTIHDYTGYVFNPFSGEKIYSWNTQPTAPFADLLKRFCHPAEFALEYAKQKEKIFPIIFSSFLSNFVLNVAQNFPEDLQPKAEEIWKSWKVHQKQTKQTLNNVRYGSIDEEKSILKSQNGFVLNMLKKLDQIAQKEKRPATRYWLKLCRVRLEADKALFKQVMETKFKAKESTLSRLIQKAPEHYQKALENAEKNNWWKTLTRNPNLSDLLQYSIKIKATDDGVVSKKSKKAFV